MRQTAPAKPWRVTPSNGRFPPRARRQPRATRSQHWLGVSEWLGREHCPLGHRPRVEVPPQLHQQPPGQGYDPDPPDPTTPLAEALLVPPTQRTLRLKPQPAPRDLDRHGPNVAVARLANPLLPTQLATLIRRRR